MTASRQAPSLSLIDDEPAPEPEIMTVVPSTSEAQVLKREMQEDHIVKDSATLTPERQQTDGSTK